MKTGMRVNVGPGGDYHTITEAIQAVPYDMPVIGYGAKNIGTLRLWQTESLHEIDFKIIF